MDSITDEMEKNRDIPGKSGNPEDFLDDALFYALSEKAERIRWQMHDIPWQDIDRSKVDKETLDLVREVAYSELTTYSASQQFLKDFGDDPDFTQWVSIWFYEETRHPQVLLKWLRTFGVNVGPDFLMQGRGIFPFMKSRMGTLVTNVISEMAASAVYLNLHEQIAEPVLSAIALNISHDEARHANSFYVYAKRLLERSENPERDRRDAIKVLYMWFQNNSDVHHPVNEFLGHLRGREDVANLRQKVEKDFSGVLVKACKKIGNLVGVPISDPEGILAYLRS